MKKLAFLLTIVCVGQLYGMEAQNIGGLPKELQTKITQTAIASSKNINEAIEMISTLSASFGIPPEKLFNNLKDFTKLVHILVDKFDLSPREIAEKFNTQTSKDYIELGDKLRQRIYISKNSPVDPTNDVIKLIEQDGADINYFRSNGMTALHQAVINLDPKMVQLLLNYGANPNLKYNHNPELRKEAGLTPLQWILEPYRVAPNNEKAEEIIEILKEAIK